MGMSKEEFMSRYIDDKAKKDKQREMALKYCTCDIDYKNDTSRRSETKHIQSLGRFC